MNNLKDFIAKLYRDAHPVPNYEYSYKDFHAKDVTYYCLFRSPQLTVKLYDIKGREGFVVAPHTHRYDFKTYCLLGNLHQIEFTREGYHDHPYRQQPKVFICRKYKTKLDGVPAFEYMHDQGLTEEKLEIFPGASYYFEAEKIHTIVTPHRTILLLLQFEDRFDYSYFFSKERELPNFDGLYNKMPLLEYRNGVERILDEC